MTTEPAVALIAIADQFPGLTLHELVFVDQALRNHGASFGPAFGDYSSGLVPLGRRATIEIVNNGSHYMVSMVCHTGGWDFTVSIDRDTGALIDPVQGEFSPA